MVSTVVLIAGVAGGAVASIGDPAAIVAAGSAVAGTLLGSFTAIGALDGPAQADSQNAKNTIARRGIGISRILVRIMSNPVKDKQVYASIISGNLRLRARKSDKIMSIRLPASVVLSKIRNLARFQAHNTLH